jgi:hypothetical protein
VRSPSRVQPVARQARAALRRDKWTVIISDASIVRRQYRSYCRNRNYCGTKPYLGFWVCTRSIFLFPPSSFIVVDAWGHSAAEWDAPA